MRGDLIPIQHADWNTDHLGTDHLRANRISISWANHERAHHVRAHHFRAITAPDHLGANNIIADRGANPGADRIPHLLSDRAANNVSDLGSDHFRANCV